MSGSEQNHLFVQSNKLILKMNDINECLQSSVSFLLQQARPIDASRGRPLHTPKHELRCKPGSSHKLRMLCRGAHPICSTSNAVQQVGSWNTVGSDLGFQCSQRACHCSWTFRTVHSAEVFAGDRMDLAPDLCVAASV